MSDPWQCPACNNYVRCWACICEAVKGEEKERKD